MMKTLSNFESIHPLQFHENHLPENRKHLKSIKIELKFLNNTQ